MTVVKADRLANINFAACGTPDGEDYVVDLGAEKPVYFDLNRVKVTDPNGGDVDYTFEIKDDEGKTYADDSALRNPGTYYVTVNAWEYVNGELVAQSKTVKVVVSYDNVTEQNNIFFVFDGKNYAESDTAPAEYDGTDPLPPPPPRRCPSPSRSATKTLVEGTDYDVTIERSDADGGWTKVDSIVDAGDYVITVTGKTFSETAKFSLHVDPDGARREGGRQRAAWPPTRRPTSPYTGDVLTPTFSFYKDGAEVEVPADAFEVTYDAIGTNNGLPNPSAPIDTDVELKAKGAYKATFSATEAGANYDFDGRRRHLPGLRQEGLPRRARQRVVQPGGLHRPRQRLHERRRLGQDLLPDARAHPRRGGLRAVQHGRRRRVLQERDIDGYDPDGKVFETGFSDVAGNEFYAKAIAWAEQTGVHQRLRRRHLRRLPQGDQRGVRLHAGELRQGQGRGRLPSLTPTRSSRATPTPPSSPTGQGQRRLGRLRGRHGQRSDPLPGRLHPAHARGDHGRELPAREGRQLSHPHRLAIRFKAGPPLQGRAPMGLWVDQSPMGSLTARAGCQRGEGRDGALPLIARNGEGEGGPSGPVASNKMRVNMRGAASAAPRLVWRYHA